MPTVDPDRRRLVAGGAVATAALWAAPSVTTFDRVAAATGSCGIAPVQLDWSNEADNSTPGTITAGDGTEVSFSLSTATSPGPENFTVRHVAMGGLSDLLILEMSPGERADVIEVQIDFSRPVELCFTLVEVDRSPSEWEDTVSVVGSDAGTPVDLGLQDLFLFGTAVEYVGPNTVRGRSPIQPGSDAANVDVRYPAAVDRVRITYTDQKQWASAQSIGIHDLRWC